MSEPRIVTLQEARRHLEVLAQEPRPWAENLAHTVVVQGQRIADVLDLCDFWQKTYTTPLRETDAAMLSVIYQIRDALGVKQ